jgi:hypothetical protein
MGVFPIADLTENDAYSGPRLPHLLGSNKTERWTFSLKEATGRPIDPGSRWEFCETVQQALLSCTLAHMVPSLYFFYDPWVNACRGAK